MRQRILYLDFLRVIATFAVIMLHVSAMCVADSSIFPSTEWEIANIFDSMTRFCVPLFVMISGYLFLNPAKPITIKNIYLKYVARIVCAFIFWSTIYALYNLFFHGIPLNIADIIHGPMHLWFLFMICGLYIATPILRLIAKSNKITVYFIIIAFIFTFSIPCISELSTNIFPGTTEAIGLFNKTLSTTDLSIIAGFSAYFISGHALRNNTLIHSKLAQITGG